MSSATNVATVLNPQLAYSDPVFDLAPISLWLEDYSLVRQLLEPWNLPDGAALQRFFAEDRSRVRACADLIRVVKVNRKTLDLMGAANERQLFEGIAEVFRDDTLDNLACELVALWDGAGEFSSRSVNYTLGGERLDIIVNGRILPGYEKDWGRVLLSVQDVTELEAARRATQAAQRYANGLFENSPVSLWVQDFSAVKQLFEEVRALGISDFRTFTDVNPDFVMRCASEVRIIDVNQHTLKLYGAQSKPELLNGLDTIFRSAPNESFRELLNELWAGKLFQQREVMNFALDGSEIYLHLQFSILPGAEQDWSLAQVALTDITARKKAESYLEYLGKNDVLTKLHNRSFYTDELARLERKGPFPVTILVIDVNGLKEANDKFGHAAGDDLLRRTGEVLMKAVERPNIAARIGGDEFVVMMPGSDSADAQAMIDDILDLVALNNTYHKGKPLHFAIGAATSAPGQRLDQIVRLADERMYDNKRKNNQQRK